VFFFQGASTEIPKEVVMYRLCEKFGWTYKEIMNQPSDFIDKMITIMSIENKLKNGRK